jgi:YHS domain-containing protein
MRFRSVLAVFAVAALGVFAIAQAAEKDPLAGVKCVVSGKPINAKAFVDYKGGKTYFCCPNCPKAFKANTAKFATKANAQLAATKQAKQVACPVSGKPTKAAHATTIASVSVAFCCPNCKKKADSASGDAQLAIAFSDKAFAKGFKVKK